MPANVAIVILNWNGRAHLEQFLPSVMASTYPDLSVVVIDNGSSDDSVSFLQQQYPSITIVQLDANYGFAGGYNRGLKQVNAEYYVLLNSDVETTPGWIEPMLSLLESDTSIAACQPKLLQYHQKDLFEYAGASGGWIDFLGYPFARGRIFDVCEKDEGQYDSTVPVFWASGAALMIRSRCFQEAGGFDEYFFAHQEEIDLCWRLQWLGYQVYCCPESVVFHVGGGTLPKGNARKVFLNFRNNLVMLAKNLPVGEAIAKIAWRFILDAISATKSLLAGEGTYFIAVFRAHIAFLTWLFFKRSKSIFPRKISRARHGYLKKSIVWQHFILGKKKFLEIVDNKT